MSAAAIIPARYASTRFPGKPLANDTGKYLIQHVYEQVRRARSINQVIVATDDERIRRAVESFGGRAAMTRPDHPTGTDRVAEVAAGLDADIIVNVQGDEPEIDPTDIDKLVGSLADDPEVLVATLACPFPPDADPRDPNAVKVVLDSRGRALYFSRGLIPYPRDSGLEQSRDRERADDTSRDETSRDDTRRDDTSRDETSHDRQGADDQSRDRQGAVHGMPGVVLPPPAVGDLPTHLGISPVSSAAHGPWLLHLGIYAYRRDFLLHLATLPPTPLEQIEKLEQLRVLETGRDIVVAVVARAAVGIDTPADYAAFVKRLHGTHDASRGPNGG